MSHTNSHANIGERVPMNNDDVRAMYRILNSQFMPILVGKIDLTRGRVLERQPADWHFWNTEGKRIQFSVDPATHTAMLSVAKERDDELPAPLHADEAQE